MVSTKFELPTTKPYTMRLKEINSTVIALNNGLSNTHITPSNKGKLFPIAPSVTAYCTENNSSSYNYFFRVVVFIDSDYTQKPTFCIDETTGVDFYVVFDLPEKEPTSYTAWYIESTHQMSQLGDVTVYLRNSDPRTSRGTVTTVIIETPIDDISGY